MTKQSLFEKIANQELPGYIIWETNTHCAFLNIYPSAKGHTLVIPKKNIGDNLFNLDDTDYQELMHASKQVAQLLMKKMKLERIFVSVEGIEVPHVHIHLLPAQPGISMEKLSRYEASTDELREMQQLLLA